MPPALGTLAAEMRGSVAARQAAGTLLQIGVIDPINVCKQTARPECRSQPLPAGDPQHAMQKSGGLAEQWYMDDGDIMCHPILMPSFLQAFDVANARVGADRNPLKTEVIYYVNDLDAAPPEWRVGDELGQKLCSH